MNELSRWDRFWIGVLGALPDLARDHPVDIPALRTFGYQLFALWLLFFVIQGIALTVITQSVLLGGFLAALSSTILILAERIFVNGDWFNEGHYWTVHESNPDDPELKRIRRRRGIYIASRLAIGILISVSVITLAEPALFGLEQSHYARLDARNFEPEANAEHKSCKQRVATTIANLMRDQQRCTSGEVTGITDSPTHRRLALVDRRIDTLETRKREFKERQGAECGGLAYQSDNPAIRATGRAKCGLVADAWKRQADAVEPELAAYRAEKRHLEAEISGAQAEAATVTRQRLAQCPKVAGDLREAKEREQRDLDQCDRRLKTAGGAAEDRMGGLMRTIQYHLRMKADSDRELRGHGANPNGVWWYLWGLKLFVILLECALFLSKVLGQVRGYSKAIYQIQAGISRGA